ncbi:MAG: hypothetical protein ABIO17_04275 [Pseudoxanthomonas sp.]
MNRILFLCVTGALFVANPAMSADDEPANASSKPLGHEWVRVDPARLAGMRGGMQLPSGLSLSFGIDRVVYVNGDLVAATRVNVPDISHMTSEQAAALVSLNQGMVVQIGARNVVTPGTASNGLVIQNTLDNQDIRALTTLQVGADTLGMLQEINSYDALRNAMIASPGGP